jgi:hypothetical protein
MHGHECARHDDKAASRLAPKGGYGRFDLTDGRAADGLREAP